LVGLAQELSQQYPSHFDSEQFTVDVSSQETEQALKSQINLARTLTQQGFPSLVLEHDGTYYQIPVDYNDHQQTLEAVISKVR
jgi:putative protein-disulfide isomerase